MSKQVKEKNGAERLTVPDLHKVYYDPWELCGMNSYCTKGCHEEGGCTGGCHILKMYRKLAAYEDAEEQGTLLRLPCRVGETVYRICPKCNDKHNGSCSGCAWENSATAHGCQVYGNVGTKTLMGCQIVPYKVSWEYLPSLMEDLGKTVFLTRKEAEQKLEEIQKGEGNNEQIG